jgi:hypothetical protein
MVTVTPIGNAGRDAQDRRDTQPQNGHHITMSPYANAKYTYQRCTLDAIMSSLNKSKIANMCTPARRPSHLRALNAPCYPVILTRHTLTSLTCHMLASLTCTAPQHPNGRNAHPQYPPTMPNTQYPTLPTNACLRPNGRIINFYTMPVNTHAIIIIIIFCMGNNYY